jgi:tetratricopeptide (TPR) repeat protein
LLAFGFRGWVHGPAPAPSSSTEPKDPLAAIAQAEEISDPMQRCLEFPAPRGLDWPKAYVEAFCMDTLSPSLSAHEISDAIENRKAAELDTRLDAILDGYFAHRVPEGVVYQAWNRFRGSSATAARFVDRWLDQVPNSANARAARGMIEVERARESRGEDTIANTPGGDLEKMRAALETAQRDLEQALSANPRLLPAYVALLRVARFGGDDALAKRTLDRALGVDPAGYFVRGEYLTSLEPRWGGSFEAMDRFAEAAAPEIAANPRLAALKLDALAARGLPFYWKHDYRTALQHFERGLAVAPDAFYLDVGQFAAGKAGDDVRAVELISQYMRFMPYDAKKYAARAYYLKRLHRDAWAEADYAVAHRSER